MISMASVSGEASDAVTFERSIVTVSDERVTFGRSSDGAGVAGGVGVVSLCADDVPAVMRTVSPRVKTRVTSRTCFINRSQ